VILVHAVEQNAAQCDGRLLRVALSLDLALRFMCENEDTKT